MARFTLKQTAEYDVAVNFRYEIIIMNTDPAVAANGLTDNIVGYASSAELPCAPGEAIEWYLPMGMRNHQAGKRKTKPISLEFVIPTNGAQQRQSIFSLLETWGNNCYNLNRGTNRSKANYCTDGIHIRLRTEGDAIAYTFQLLRAQPTDINYGSLSSEGNDLIKCSMTLVYDNYKVFSGADGNPLLTDTTAYT